MPAQRSQLSAWFDEGVSKGATHMIVKCDAFEYRGGANDGCCYPVFVMPGEDAHQRERDNSDRLMEVYDLAADKDPQINTSRCVTNWGAA